MDIAIVIPVFCGEKTLQELFDRIKGTLLNLYSFEVIFVHDGGTDSSWEKICNLKKIYGALIKGIKLTRNFGQHNAILCGIEYSESSLIVTMDEDLQHNPEDIINLIKCQKENNSDLVYGSYVKRKHSILRNILSFLLKSILSMIIPGLYKGYTSFRLIKKETAKRIITLSSPNVFLDGSLARLDIKVNSVAIKHYKSAVGKSSYSAWKLCKHTLRTLLSFSDIPVRYLLQILMGIFFSIISLSVFWILIKHYITGNQIIEFKFILLLSLGIVLCLLGLVFITKAAKRADDLSIRKPKYILDKII